MTYLGLDVGGTKCAAILGTDRGEILEKRGWASEAARGPDAMIADLVRAGLELKTADVAAVGVAIGGPMNAATGVILSPPNLPSWDRIPLKKILESKLGIPAVVEHDAAACALAEYRWGAGQSSSRLAYLTCGTGFGVGLVVDGAAYHGANGSTMEIGHLRCRDEGPEAFGKEGTFEAIASLEGLSRLANHLFPVRWTTPPKPSDVAELAASGDAEARVVVKVNAEAVGIACATLVDLLGVDTIVLGSAASRLGDPWLAQVRASFASEALRDRVQSVKIVPSSLGDALQDLSPIAAALATRQS